MIESIGIAAAAGLVLSAAQLWVLDRIGTVRLSPAGEGKQTLWWEGWCYRMMTEEIIASAVTAAIVAAGFAYLWGGSVIPAFASLVAAAALWAFAAKKFSVFGDGNLSLWNGRSTLLVLGSIVAAVLIAMIVMVIIGTGGLLPLVAAVVAFAVALIVSFLSGVG